MGIISEADHKLDKKTTMGLITDHLREDPKYYTHLKEMTNKYKGKQLGL